MGAQLILGAQQILMVLGAQGAQGAQTMNCTKAKSKIASFSVQPFMVKFEFEIYNCEFCSFLLFLQGEFQEKVNKLESESENEGQGRHFGKFSY